jgi:hypothetical protein
MGAELGLNHGARDHGRLCGGPLCFCAHIPEHARNDQHRAGEYERIETLAV